MRRKLTKVALEARTSGNNIAYFYEQLAKGVLVGSRCNKCKALFVPPRALCTRCYGKLVGTTLSGRGTIETFTIVQLPVPELSHLAPYASIVVRLEEGPAVLGMLPSARKPDGALFGARVKVDFRACSGVTPGYPRLVFKLSS